MLQLHSPVIRTEVASTLVAESPYASLEQFQDRLRDLGRCEGVIWLDDSITVTDLRRIMILPGQWHGILCLLRDTDLVIRRLAYEGKIVSEVSDRLCSWEFALASEADAKKRHAPAAAETCSCLSHAKTLLFSRSTPSAWSVSRQLPRSWTEIDMTYLNFCQLPVISPDFPSN